MKRCHTAWGSLLHYLVIAVAAAPIQQVLLYFLIIINMSSVICLIICELTYRAFHNVLRDYKNVL